MSLQTLAATVAVLWACATTAKMYMWRQLCALRPDKGRFAFAYADMADGTDKGSRFRGATGTKTCAALPVESLTVRKASPTVLMVAGRTRTAAARRTLFGSRWQPGDSRCCMQKQMVHAEADARVSDTPGPSHPTSDHRPTHLVQPCQGEGQIHGL